MLIIFLNYIKKLKEIQNNWKKNKEHLLFLMLLEPNSWFDLAHPMNKNTTRLIPSDFITLELEKK